MRYTILFILFAIPSLLFAQKMLDSHEWCGHKHALMLPSTNMLEDGRSDSINIVRYDIALDLMNAPQITASCSILLRGKVNGVSEVRLDLEGLTVDDVQDSNQSSLPFSQVGNSLFITLAQPLEINSTTTINISYHGVPKMDASGWGGFYNTGGYTFNLGVGFAADPHVFGRAWFPCFDNFVERAVFFTTITTPLGKPGYSNGNLFSEDTTGGKLHRAWFIPDPIPSYLACFSSGPYTSFKKTYTGENGLIPMEIACAPGDTNKVKGTFQNMQKAVEAFEYWYGPYLWDKIGYSLVPFNSGAMEHATNIAIGRAYIDGTLNYETLWAHELSHHWWGDLATCSTAEDMWLNEGWASYSEHLFTEKVYGKTAFQNAVRANHLNVLQNAHIAEGGYRAVSGVPHSLTYGTHVYNKGASMAHNLRGYLGDSLFRVGCRASMNQTQFDDWSSAGFRDKLEAATGKDLHDFFEDWVFSGGYADYSVDSIQLIYSPIDAPTIARVFVKQKLRGAPHFHHNVPLEFTILMNDGQKQYRTATVSGENSMVEFEFPAFGPSPQSVFINTRLKILQARSELEKMLKTTGGTNAAEAKFSLNVNALGADSVFFRVEHHFAAPDKAGANPNGFALSNRYWSVYPAGSQFPAGFDAQATLLYDGRGQGDQLDKELFDATSPSEDSVLLLYRPGAGHPWQEWPSYTKLTLGSTSDSYGQLRPTHIIPGEYCIGKGVSTSGVRTPNALGKVRTSPNPSTGLVRVMADEAFESVTLIGVEGQTEQTWNFAPGTETTIDLSGLAKGQYWLLLNGKKGLAICPIARQ